MVITLKTFVQVTSHCASRCTFILPFDRIKDITVLTLYSPDIRLALLRVCFRVFQAQVDDDLLAQGAKDRSEVRIFGAGGDSQVKFEVRARAFGVVIHGDDFHARIHFLECSEMML